MGNAVSVTRVWSIHTKTQLVGRRQPMTSLLARPHYKRAPGLYIILFFVFTDCFVWSVHSDGKNYFLQAIMASTSKAFKSCVDPCPCYLTLDDTHNLCVFCLGEEHARNVLEEAICVHCEHFSMKKLRSRLSLFLRKERQLSASCDSGPTVAEARRRMRLWGSQVDLGLCIVWILSIPILLIDSDSFRFTVSIPMWLNNDIKHLSCVSF